MADIKRDFLYEFNRGLRDIYSTSSSIVSVFENIDNGVLKLSPVGITEEDFVKEIGKVIFMIKRIVADPYKSFTGKQEIVPVSQAQNVDSESIRLTMSDSTVWSVVDGKITPKQAYTLTKDYVFINYENAFISQLINLIIVRLKKIKTKIASEVTDKSTDEYKEFIETVDSYVRKLMRLSNEKVFADNSRRSIDMSTIFVTDILNSDNRYNFCYKFFCEKMRSRSATASVTKDFRVLYHNYAFVKILHCFNKLGYVVSDADYYISTSGKIFLNTVAARGERELAISQTRNGIDVSCGEKCVHVEFSKVLYRNNNQILSDFASRNNNCDEYTKYYVAYLTTSDELTDGALSIGYMDADKAINEIINSL